MPRAVACECHLTVARIVKVLVLSLAGCVVESSLAKEKRERKKVTKNKTTLAKRRKGGRDGGEDGVGVLSRGGS